MEINVLRVVRDTTVDGPGFRTSVYCAGCAHRCEGCHNPQSWAFGGGEARSVDSLLGEIMEDPFADVTFTGGDPLYQAAAFAELAGRVKAASDKTVWCYTGFRYEELLGRADREALLARVDVLVDGPFVAALRDEDLLFRGSSNQRLIDMARTRASGRVTLWHPDWDV